MTWQETHTRTNIIREVEAAAALDMSGALPWREEWSAYFGSPEGLLTALRSRWQRMCEAQLDARSGEDVFADTYRQLQRTHAGILAILRKAAGTAAGDGVAAGAKVLALTGASLVPAPSKSRRLRGGPVGR